MVLREPNESAHYSPQFFSFTAAFAVLIVLMRLAYFCPAPSAMHPAHSPAANGWGFAFLTSAL
jgi:hypothetical protein